MLNVSMDMIDLDYGFYLFIFYVVKFSGLCLAYRIGAE